MLIACKCLNISLKSATNSLSTASKVLSPTNDSYEMQSDDHHQQLPYLQAATIAKLKGTQLHFFKTAKTSTASSITPTIQHTNLVNVTLIENWNVHSCVHCKTITHAQAIDSTNILINPMLWTNQEKINAIKASKHYSKSFKILLMSTTRRKNDAIDSSVSEMSDAKHVQNGNGRAKPLRQYLHDVVQVETEAAQNRIEQYAKEQNALLKLFREKAEQDFDEILRSLEGDGSDDSFGDDCSLQPTNTETPTGGSSLSANSKLLSDLTPPITPDSTPMSIGNSPNFKQTSFLHLNQSSVQRKIPSKINHSTPDKSYQSQRSNANIDDEIFFDMDGVDVVTTAHSSKSPQMLAAQSDDEDDVDYDDEINSTIGSRSGGMKITSVPKKGGSKIHIAQSLPMAVPNFNQRNEDEYEEYPDRQDNVDIAASIKALAKSVHGEAIFGDLPRPRFSTQI